MRTPGKWLLSVWFVARPAAFVYAVLCAAPVSPHAPHTAHIHLTHHTNCTLTTQSPHAPYTPHTTSTTITPHTTLHSSLRICKSHLQSYTMYAVPGEKRQQSLIKILPWKAFRTIFLPLVVACSSAARSGKPCPPLDLRPCCMSLERPF